MRNTAMVVLVLAVAPYIFFLEPALACSRVSGPPIKVKSAFVVIVQDPNGSPLPNMKVTAYEAVRKSGDVPAHVELAAIAVTGKDGKAAVGLVQDDYSLGATANGITSEVIQIQVYDDGPGASEVRLTWPGGPITEVQNVAGVLALGKEKDPWAGAEIALKDAVSDKSLAEVVSDSHGGFKFTGVPPGFYALHVRAKNPGPPRLPQLEGDISIRVRNDAANYELPTWGFVASSCGLAAYKDAQSMIIFTP